MITSFKSVWAAHFFWIYSKQNWLFLLTECMLCFVLTQICVIGAGILAIPEVHTACRSDKKAQCFSVLDLRILLCRSRGCTETLAVNQTLNHMVASLYHRPSLFFWKKK